MGVTTHRLSNCFAITQPLSSMCNENSIHGGRLWGQKAESYNRDARRAKGGMKDKMTDTAKAVMWEEGQGGGNCGGQA